MDNRVFDLTGIHNCRDYGGYVGSHGRLRTGVLYRSGHHIDATDSDLDVIEGFGLKSVIDLRGASERVRYPCRRKSGFAAQVLFAQGETSSAGGAAHAAGFRHVVTKGDAHAAMIDVYAHMAERPNLIVAFRHYFQSLANRSSPSLIHCFAGKDRTGLAVAILHTVLGVHPDDIIQDYILTNSVGNSEARIAAGLGFLRQSRPNADEDALVQLMMVDPAYLQSAFATINAKWGSVEDYAEQVLGVDAAQRKAIRSHLIE